METNFFQRYFKMQAKVIEADLNINEKEKSSLMTFYNLFTHKLKWKVESFLISKVCIFIKLSKVLHISVITIKVIMIATDL